MSGQSSIQLSEHSQSKHMETLSTKVNHSTVEIKTLHRIFILTKVVVRVSEDIRNCEIEVC